MKRLLSIFLLINIITSCDSWPDYSHIDCNNPDLSTCNQIEPTEGTMKISVTIDNENLRVPIAFFEGKMEESNLVYLDTLTTSTRTYYVPTDIYFTVTATYNKNGKTIIAVDGDIVYKHATQVCDFVCWDVKNASVDLRLEK